MTAQGGERGVSSAEPERDWVRIVARETCEDCGLRASAPGREALAEALRDAAREWDRLLNGTAPVRLRRVEGPGRWSALEYGAHTAGVLGLFTERIELAVTVEDPQFGWWDHEEAATRERYNEQPPTRVAASVVGSAARMAGTLDALDDAMWARTGTRRPGERFSVEGLARFALHEARHHLRDARRLLDDPPPERRADLGFGRNFTDHMAIARYTPAQGWTEIEVVPFAELALSPAAMVFHYGQAVFEGLKAFRQPDGEVALFRPHDHAARFDLSARSLVMPEPADGAVVAACLDLVRADIGRVPREPGHSLYLRPMLFAAEAALGVRAATEYLFVVMASVVGSYFSSGARPLTLWVEQLHSRAVPGGTGSAKCSGNYAASLRAKQGAATSGCDEVLWLDAIEHRWVEELSGMNVVFVADGRDGPSLVTPAIGETILDGITRRSLLALARHLGYQVVERPVAIEEVCEPGAFVEAFACGTASGVVPIGALRLGRSHHAIGAGQPGPVTLRLRDELSAMQEGRSEDHFGWRLRVAG